MTICKSGHWHVPYRMSASDSDHAKARVPLNLRAPLLSELFNTREAVN